MHNREDLAKRRQVSLVRILERGLVLSPREKALVDNMLISPRAIIARVFYYDFEARVNYDNAQTEDQIAKDNDFYVHTMPFAFVVKAGSELSFDGQKVEQGDIIRLYDRKTRTLINPRHAAYYNNKGTDSNFDERLGVEPSKFIHMIHENFRENVFFIDPLKDPDLADFHTFRISEPDIFGLFKNKEILLDGLDTI